MDKSIKQSVAMSESGPLALVNMVLNMKGQISNQVSSDTQAKIQGLRGILDSKTLSSARNGGDWRRGAGSGGASSSPSGSHSVPYRFQTGSRTPMRTSASTGSLAGGFSPSSPLSGKPTPVYTGPPLGRYQSRFKNNSEPLEEKILNRIIRLKLNKFGPTTYMEIRDFLFQILGQECVQMEEGGQLKTEEGQVAEFVMDFMLMVFRKAAAEEMYCPLYAKLLAEIGAKHSVIFEEMNRLYKNYMEIFEEADVNTAADSMESFEKKVLEKKYRQGYSQFIAELSALEILSVESLAQVFHTLISLIDKHSRIVDRRPLVEEYVDCLLRMSRVLKEKQSEFFRGARVRLLGENRETIQNLIHIRDSTYPSLSPKSRFLLMDIQDILTSS
jgi:hypothetical protein